MGGAHFCAGAPHFLNPVLPTVKLTVNGLKIDAVVDTGCSISIIDENVARQSCCLVPCYQSIILMNGGTAPVNYKCMSSIIVNGRTLKLECLVSKLFPGCRMLLGMDAITRLGGIRIRSSSCVNFVAVAQTFPNLQNEHVIDVPDFI